MPYKKTRLRLYADENFPITSVVYLKSIGISIVHAYDRNVINKDDEYHIKEAKRLERTLITIDRDFLYYSAVGAQGSQGAIVNEICFRALSKITPNFAKGSFIKITANKIHRNKNGVIDEISYWAK